MRKLVILCLITVVAALAASPAIAGEGHDLAAEMAKCHMCKAMAPHMNELMPVMQHTMIDLDNGVAMLCTITDASKVATYHGVCDQMEKSAADLATFTPEQAKDKLCPLCFEMWGVMAEGATVSAGKTDDGHLLVLNSNDPAVQADIDKLMEHWKMMMNPGS